MKWTFATRQIFNGFDIGLSQLSVRFLSWIVIVDKKKQKWVFRWAKDQNANYEGIIVFILTIQIDLRNKKITLARGLTTVQNKQEINENRTCKST